MYNNIFHTDCLDLCKWVEDSVVDLIIIDPPYLTTSESWDQEEVVSEELSQELFRIAKSSCSLYCWCGIGEKSQSLMRWFPVFSKLWKFKDLVVWKKQRGMGMRRGWLRTHEEIMWFVKDNEQFIWNKEFQYSDEKRKTSNKYTEYLPLSEYKRLTTVWIDISEATTGNLKYRKKLHATPKPQKAIERIILAHTKENDVVFDCFVGSGTTCVAAKKLNRQYIAGDSDERYVNITKERLNVKN